MSEKNYMANEETFYIKDIKGYKFKKFLKYFFTYFLLALQGIIVLLPFYIMILTSVKDRASFASGNTTYNFVWWVPIKDAIKNATVNYKYAYDVIHYGKVMFNTVVVAVIGTVGTVITTVLAAYAFARLNFKGKNLLFTIFMATMMLPGEVFIITNYVTVSNFHWIGTGWFTTILAETIPFMTSIYYIYYLRQTFMSVPDELYYAAKVDGTSDFKYLFKVMVPISSGTIISITILNAMSSWNAYVWPTLVSTEEELYLVTQALRHAPFTIGQSGMIDYGSQMAAAFLVTAPLLIVFFALKKYIMRGVSRSGIKG